MKRRILAVDISLNKAKYKTRATNKAIKMTKGGNNAHKSANGKGSRNLTVRAASRRGTKGMVA